MIINLARGYRHGFDMMNAASMSMGFLRSLYYEQVKKSVADAKEKEAKEAMQKAQEPKAPGYDRANQRLQQVNINRYKKRMRNMKQQQSPPVQSSSYNMEDLEEALEELE